MSPILFFYDFYLHRSGKFIFTNKPSSSGIYRYSNGSMRSVKNPLSLSISGKYKFWCLCNVVFNKLFIETLYKTDFMHYTVYFKIKLSPRCKKKLDLYFLAQQLRHGRGFHTRPKSCFRTRQKLHFSPLWKLFAKVSVGSELQGRWTFFWMMQYSQTCIKRPPKGSLKSGLLIQVVS